MLYWCPLVLIKPSRLLGKLTTKMKQEISSIIKSHKNAAKDNSSNINDANELFYPEYEFEDDGSICCECYSDFIPVLKHLMERGCPPSKEVIISAWGNTDITLNVGWAWSPEHEEVDVTVLYNGIPVRFWRDIKLRNDLNKGKYQKYKKYESQIDFDELEKFIEDLQNWTVHAIEFYYFGSDWQRVFNRLEIWKEIKDEYAQ